MLTVSAAVLTVAADVNVVDVDKRSRAIAGNDVPDTWVPPLATFDELWHAVQMTTL